MTDEAQYMLMAGAALLRNGFNDESIGAVQLLLGALLPTVVAIVFFLV